MDIPLKSKRRNVIFSSSPVIQSPTVVGHKTMATEEVYLDEVISHEIGLQNKSTQGNTGPVSSHSTEDFYMDCQDEVIPDSQEYPEDQPELFNPLLQDSKFPQASVSSSISSIEPLINANNSVLLPNRTESNLWSKEFANGESIGAVFGNHRDRSNVNLLSISRNEQVKKELESQGTVSPLRNTQIHESTLNGGESSRKEDRNIKIEFTTPEKSHSAFFSIPYEDGPTGTPRTVRWLLKEARSRYSDIYDVDPNDISSLELKGEPLCTRDVLLHVLEDNDVVKIVKR